MKILFLTPWYPDEQSPYHGIFIQDQAKALTLAHEIVVISSKVDYSQFSLFGYTIKESNVDGLKEVRVQIKRSIPLYNQINYFLISVLVASRISKTFKPDVIHGNIGYPGAFWSYLVSILIKKPYFITEHTKIENNFRSLWHKWLTLTGYRNAAGVITVSNWMATLFHPYQIKRVTVIPNVVRANQYRIEKRVPTSSIQIGLLGSLFSEKHTKGLDLLLEALNKVSFSFHLHIGGGGKMLDWYKQYAIQQGIAEHCIFYGQLQPAQIPDFMARLDLFVCASRVESFGVALLEAMASGVPVLSTNCGGPADFIKDANGLLIEKGSVVALRDGLEVITKRLKSYNPEEIRKFVVENFSDESFLEKITKLYQAKA